MTEKDKNEQLKHSGEQRKATKKQPPPLIPSLHHLPFPLQWTPHSFDQLLPL